MKQIKLKINSLICFGFICVLTVHTFGSQEENTNPCPELLGVILSHQENTVKNLLEDGANPNASLKNCQFPIERPSVFSFSKTYYDLTRYSTLLHVAALFTNYYHSIYDLLIEHGADEEALDHRDLTPDDVKRSDNITYVGGQSRLR